MILDAPIFTVGERDAPRSPLTIREAILWSLLAHAVVLIAILLAPKGTFAPHPARFLRQSGEEPVKMTFIQDRPRPPQPNPFARAGSDRDRARAQEDKPKNPSRMEPFSRGNTPAKIAEGPLAPPGPPAGAPAPPTEPAAKSGASAFDAKSGMGPFYVPPQGDRSQGSGEGDPALREKGERLRQALSQMGAAGSGGGGSRYRFDNPTGGLNSPTGSLSFDTKGFDWGPYARRIYWIIWSNWHQRMPPAVYAGLKGQVTIHFVIHRDGRITDITVVATSGIPAYDNAATLALEASSPLPSLPVDFPYESDGVTARFLYNIWEED